MLQNLIERRIKDGLPKIAKIICPHVEWPLLDDNFSRVSQAPIRSAEAAIRKVADICVNPARERSALAAIVRRMKSVRAACAQERRAQINDMIDQIEAMICTLPNGGPVAQQKRVAVMASFDLLCEYRQDLRRTITDNKSFLVLAALIYEIGTGRHGSVKREALALFEENSDRVEQWRKYVDDNPNPNPTPEPMILPKGRP
jgi:hypothetical protein